jgi:hypothetical protein
VSRLSVKGLLENNSLPPGESELSADVIWGKKIRKSEIREKGRKGKEKE